MQKLAKFPISVPKKGVQKSISISEIPKLSKISEVVNLKLGML